MDLQSKDMNSFSTQLLLLLLFGITGADLCSFHVCFTWRVALRSLTLTCKVHALRYEVYIYNQFGNLQADCVPPSPNSVCSKYYKNGSVELNVNGQEIVYTVNGNIDARVNGNWTCRHGRNLDVATVEVTVLKDKTHSIDDVSFNVGSINTNITKKRSLHSEHSGQDCISKLLLLTLCGLIIASLVFSICTCCTPGIVVITALSGKFVVPTNIILNHVCFCPSLKNRRKGSIRVLKRICFAVLVLLVSGLSILIGWIEEKECTNESYIFGALGFISGLVCGLLLFGEKKINSSAAANGELESGTIEASFINGN